ncbi:MAG: YbjQ family protein [Chloroflexi bacterium]|nr:YbjQ family protein [Chloroflexota bacterium]MCY3695720.1 YbjQ family protein [Chloroflexota bacterium]MXX31615.1 YbjQ family protein [Chloroflexota bacterium]MXX79603.1 YbjQ family protein [Chloroflexota bacterium]MYB20920.1 YbjQ family protein [Chloroflexota bacterium]
MLVVTTPTVPNREIAEVYGLVSANSVRSRNVGRDILAGIKSLFGGEIHAYKRLMRETREQVLADLVAEAEALGADAIVMTQMASSDIGQNLAEVYMYGTAVRLK